MRVSRSSFELSGTAAAASVLCYLFSVGQLESTTFVAEPNLRHLNCFFSSPLELWELYLRRHAIVNNLVDELRLEKLDCLCVFMWGQLHLCDGLFQNRQWHLHLDDLFDDSLWGMLLTRELEQPSSLVQSMLHCQIPNVSSPNPSVDVFQRILTGSPSGNTWSSFLL